MTGHEFVRPGQVSPEWPAPDQCVRCGLSEHEHAAAGYVAEADALDETVRNGLAVLQEQADAGQIGAVEHAVLRVAVMEQHLAESRALRERYFGSAG